MSITSMSWGKGFSPRDLLNSPMKIVKSCTKIEHPKISQQSSTKTPGTTSKPDSSSSTPNPTSSTPSATPHHTQSSTPLTSSPPNSPQTPMPMHIILTITPESHNRLPILFGGPLSLVIISTLLYLTMPFKAAQGLDLRR